MLNLYWDVLRSQTHCNKAAIFKSSHKIVVIFLSWTDSVLASHTAVFPSKAELERVTERPWVLHRPDGVASSAYYETWCLSILTVSPLHILIC